MTHEPIREVTPAELNRLLMDAHRARSLAITGMFRRLGASLLRTLPQHGAIRGRTA